MQTLPSSLLLPVAATAPDCWPIIRRTWVAFRPSWPTIAITRIRDNNGDGRCCNQCNGLYNSRQRPDAVIPSQIRGAPAGLSASRHRPLFRSKRPSAAGLLGLGLLNPGERPIKGNSTIFTQYQRAPVTAFRIWPYRLTHFVWSFSQ